MTRLYTNNAVSTLSAAITTTGQTSIVLVDASAFPTPTSPDFFTCTITQAGSAETSWEEVKCTGRSGNTLTVVRGQEGSTAATWAIGDKVEIRWTALAAADAANTGISGSAVLDFGAAPGGNFATVTVYGQADIKSNSFVTAFMMYADSADHNAIEHTIVDIQLRGGNIVPGVSFDLMGFSSMRLTGQWAIQWVRTR
jgi:hypothetical protein